MSFSSSSFQYTSHNQWRVESVHNPFYDKESLRALKENGTDTTDEREKHRFSLLAHHVQPHIQLNGDEAKILNFLKDMQHWCADTYESLSKDSAEQARIRKLVSETVPRVAGGWCRDKLLGKTSLDIDIALDNVDGEQYCQCIVEYQKAMGMETRTIGIIVENPEQSKHLKTATTHIFGYPVDFANLRSEEYAADSRIPTIRYGTPKEDAHRRDLTINALFYNIRECKVEDWVETGISDLKNGIIRTPLPSFQTFLDDPLRVIRAVRMAARFHFLISDGIVNAALNPKIKDALHSKISRERVGIEIHKILKNTDPVGAFACLKEMNIHDVIFTRVHTEKGRKTFEYKNPKALQWTDELWSNALFRIRTTIRLAEENNVDAESRIGLIFSAFLSPIAPPSDNKHTLEHWIESLIMVSLRLPRKMSRNVVSILNAARTLHPYIINQHTVNNTLENVNEHYERAVKENQVQLGKLIRSFDGDLKAACFLASVLHTSGIELNENVFVENEINHGELFFQAIENSNLIEIRDMPMLLNGKDILKILGLKRGGKFMTGVMEQYVEWQIESWPCSKHDAIRFVEENKDKFNLP